MAVGFFVSICKGNVSVNASVMLAISKQKCKNEKSL